MPIGNEIAYRRSARGKKATGSLVFDAERTRAASEDSADTKKALKRVEETQHIG